MLKNILLAKISSSSQRKQIHVQELLIEEDLLSNTFLHMLSINEPKLHLISQVL